jgi:hypothetical protein
VVHYRAKGRLYSSISIQTDKLSALETKYFLVLWIPEMIIPRFYNGRVIEQKLTLLGLQVSTM